MPLLQGASVAHLHKQLDHEPFEEPEGRRLHCREELGLKGTTELLIRRFQGLLRRGSLCGLGILLLTIVRLCRLRLLRAAPELLEGWVSGQEGKIDTRRAAGERLLSRVGDLIDPSPNAPEEAGLVQVGLGPAQSVVEDRLLAAG